MGGKGTVSVWPLECIEDREDIEYQVKSIDVIGYKIKRGEMYRYALSFLSLSPSSIDVGEQVRDFWRIIFDWKSSSGAFRRTIGRHAGETRHSR